MMTLPRSVGIEKPGGWTAARVVLPAAAGLKYVVATLSPPAIARVLLPREPASGLEFAMFTFRFNPPAIVCSSTTLWDASKSAETNVILIGVARGVVGKLGSLKGPTMAMAEGASVTVPLPAS